MEGAATEVGRPGAERRGDGPQPGPATAPVDVAMAAVWAVVHGYLNVLLRGRPLAERLPANSGGRPVARLLLLCPSDGRLPDDVGALHPRLTPAGRAAEVLASVAGARSRPMGGHPVFLLRPADGAGDGDGALLLAVESVSVLRTLHAIQEAMALSGRRRLDMRYMVRQFTHCLSETLQRHRALSDWVRVVVYDPGQPAEQSLLPALLAAAGADPSPPAVSPPPSPPGAPLPVGVGVYLAWSFFHGYLALVARRRDVSGELAALAAERRLPLPLHRLVQLCPLAAGWTDTTADDLPALDDQLQPVHDVRGREAGVPALAGRSYGNFSIYRRRPDGACFALELATPLRTLSLGVASEGVPPEVYCREARAFTEELRALMQENPLVAANFAVLEVEELSQIHQKLASIA